MGAPGPVKSFTGYSMSKPSVPPPFHSLNGRDGNKKVTVTPKFCRLHLVNDSVAFVDDDRLYRDTVLSRKGLSRRAEGTSEACGAGEHRLGTMVFMCALL